MFFFSFFSTNLDLETFSKKTNFSKFLGLVSKKKKIENLQFFVVFETGYKTLKRGSGATKNVKSD